MPQAIGTSICTTGSSNQDNYSVQRVESQLLSQGPSWRDAVSFEEKQCMTEANYKRVFFASALWNLVSGSFIIGATGWIFDDSGVAVPYPAAYYYTWTAMILVFGLGYCCVYRDMFRNRDIVWMGVIGKTAFSAVFL